MAFIDNTGSLGSTTLLGRRRALGLLAVAGAGAGTIIGLDPAAARAATLTIPPAAPPAPSDAEWAAFEDFLNELAAAGTFSGAVLVTHAGVPVVEFASGLADRDIGLPIDVDSRFDIASVGKMFTGVAIGQLVQGAGLAFDDPIGKYLSGIPADIANEITIHHLLTHTSGLGDFMRRDQPYPEAARSAVTATDLLPLIVAEPLQFQPGTSHAYSNAGFMVLGAVVESLAAESYYDFVRATIFEPAGMTRTDWLVPGQDDDNTATGYMLVGDDGAPLPPQQAGGVAVGELVANTDLVPWGSPAGGAYSTVGDLQRFSSSLLDHELLIPDMTVTVLDGTVPVDGRDDLSTAYGFEDLTLNGVRIVGHGGGAPGVGAVVDMYPELDYTVAILTNCDGSLVDVHRGTQDILTS